MKKVFSLAIKRFYNIFFEIIMKNETKINFIEKDQNQIPLV